MSRILIGNVRDELVNNLLATEAGTGALDAAQGKVLKDLVESVLGQQADVYSNEKTYAVGDYCIYENVLHKCSTAISSAEEWTAGHWTKTTIANELKSIVVSVATVNNAITELNGNFSILTWKGQLAYDLSRFSFPAIVCCQKYPNGLCDVHISCMCESYIDGDSIYKIWSAQKLFTACGVNQLEFSPEQTNASIYTTASAELNVTNDHFGRVGLTLQLADDYLLLCRHYDAAMNTGGWGTEMQGLYVSGYYYRFHIYGAKYN